MFFGLQRAAQIQTLSMQGSLKLTRSEGEIHMYVNIVFE